MITLNESKAKEITSSFQVPVKPQILTDIQSLMLEKEPNISAISQRVAADVGLSSSILKVVNSPFFGLNRKVTDIRQAVMYLGLDSLNSLITSVCLKTCFKGEYAISMERFWDDAQDVANAMLYLAKHIDSDVPPDMLYTLGLFHDCGIPLLAGKYKDYKAVLLQANKEGISSITLEERYYKTNHAVLGYYMATSWHLPKDICQLILRHHEHDLGVFKPDDNIVFAFASLKAAIQIVEKAKRYRSSAEWDIHGHNTLNTLGLSALDFHDLEDDYMDLCLLEL